jgi:hypothetical protein
MKGVVYPQSTVVGRRRLRATTTGCLTSLSSEASDEESAFRNGRALSVSGWTVDIACLYTSCTPVAERNNTVCWSNDSTHPTRRMPLTRKTETRVAAVRAALRKASCPCRGSSVMWGVRMKDVFFVAYVVKEGMFPSFLATHLHLAECERLHASLRPRIPVNPDYIARLL